MPAAPTSSAELYEHLRQSGIFTPARLAALIPNPEDLPPDPQKALGGLVARGVLTQFQAEQMLAGRHRGFRLGAYVIQSQLGRGGMGAVYLAEHQELRRKVAVKVLMAAKDADHTLAIERFVREARAAAALDHPNIVRIHDVSRTGGLPFLVMEYVDGESLQQILDRSGTVPYATAADYISQAAAGLQHAYEKGFVHRDIKPANLMKDRTGVVKILDMGLARSNIDPGDKLTERLDYGAVVGTADFIAPEQALNSPHVDIRADIYSLGATFFALVTGKPPFAGNTAQKLIQHQIADIPDISSHDDSIPDEVVEIAATMMAKDPDDRYDTPGEVIAALAPWVGNSSRVMAGLARTKVGASGDLQQTIDKIATGTSSARVRRPGSSGELHVGRETNRITASSTARQSTKRLNKTKKKEKAAPKANKAAVLGTVAAGILAVGAVAWAFSGGGSGKPAKSAEDEKPAAQAKETNPPSWVPHANPHDTSAPAKKNQAKSPPAPASNERVLFKLDLGGQQPFAVRSTTEAVGGDPKNTTQKVLSRTGGGTPQAGWRSWVWHADTQMEFFCDSVGGAASYGFRNTQGPASAMLFTPNFPCPGGKVRVRIDYAAHFTGEKIVVRFKPAGSGPAFDVRRLPGTSGSWRVETFTADLKGATAGNFEFHNRDESPEAPVRIRALTVTEGAPSESTPAVGARAGRTVYEVNFDGVPTFRKNVAQGGEGVGGTDRLPPHVSGFCWAQGATGEFRVENRDGAKAIGFTNFTDNMSAQLMVWFEGVPGGELTPAKSYVARVTYRTENDATGRVNVQGGGPNYTKFASKDLPPSGEWTTVEVKFTRPIEAVGVAIDNTAVGEGNTVYVRSVQIVEE